MDSTENLARRVQVLEQNLKAAQYAGAVRSDSQRLAAEKRIEGRIMARLDGFDKSSKEFAEHLMMMVNSSTEEGREHETWMSTEIADMREGVEGVVRDLATLSNRLDRLELT